MRLKLAHMRYTGQPMHGYVAKLVLYAVQLALINAPIDEELVLSMFAESFGDRSKLLNGMDLSRLRTREDLPWNALKSRLLQE